MSYIAPAGTAMSAQDLLAGLRRGLDPDAGEALSAMMRRVSGLPHCWSVSSGRAAMTLVLRAMRMARSNPQCDEVLIPAYTCYSVPAAIARAGLRPRLCDVDPETLAMCPDALARADFSRVLTVVSSNLYGIPNPLEDYESIAARNGAWLLDDAAQALGASNNGRAVGSFGEAGLYSFDKGKVICTIQGGAIVAKHGVVAEALEHLLADLPSSAAVESGTNTAKLVIYTLCLRPAVYDLVRRLPFLGLGRTVFETRYPVTRLGRPQTGVAAELMGRLDALADIRRSNATSLADSLDGLPHVKLPRLPAGSVSAFVRYPIRITDPAFRDRAIADLEAAGIGATASFPCALVDVPEVAALLRYPAPHTPGARAVASQIVTLPTHGYCPPGMALRVRGILERASPALLVAA